MRSPPSSIVPGRKERPVLGRERTGHGGDKGGEASGVKHLRSCLSPRGNCYPTESVNASEAVQISANRDECGWQSPTQRCAVLFSPAVDGNLRTALWPVRRRRTPISFQPSNSVI